MLFILAARLRYGYVLNFKIVPSKCWILNFLRSHIINAFSKKTPTPVLPTRYAIKAKHIILHERRQAFRYARKGIAPFSGEGAVVGGLWLSLVGSAPIWKFYDSSL